MLEPTRICGTESYYPSPAFTLPPPYRSHLHRGQDVLVEGRATSNLRQIYGTSMDTYTPVTLIPYLRPPPFSNHNSCFTL